MKPAKRVILDALHNLGHSEVKALVATNEILEALHDAGWHLVSTPEWIESRSEIDSAREVRLEARVDEKVLSHRQTITDRELVDAYDFNGAYAARREHMCIGFGRSLLVALAN